MPVLGGKAGQAVCGFYRNENKGETPASGTLKRIIFLISIIFLIIPASVFGDSPPFIVFEVWIEADPFVPGSDYAPLSDDDIHQALLEKARWVAGGLVYGFEVHYVIGHRVQELDERFTMTPAGSIERGDPAFRILNTRMEGSKAFARVRYDLKEHQKRWIRRFSGVETRRIQGSGTGPLHLGDEGRMLSYEEAVKAGIRGMLQAKERNRPREVFCTILFETPPRTVVDAGSYRSNVRMGVVVHELVPHRIY